MHIGVLGTGTVGTTIASALVGLGHFVKLGSRTASNDKAIEWAKQAGERASHGTFAESASFGTLLFNCTNGKASLDALRAAGADNLGDKVLVDVSNPLDFSAGFPPTLTVCNDDSLGERIQREFPAAKVVKALNTVNASVMVDPAKVPGDHVVFVGGNDLEAKREVTQLLQQLGWKRVLDLGDISSSRGTEAYLPLWVRLYGALGTAEFNLELRTADG